ncbi:MAG: SLC13 family permease, partial [Gammaproteobacteria bacterium]
FLIEIERSGEVIPAVSGNVRLAAGDHLIFAGVVDSVVDLQRFEGLTLATDQVFKLDAKRSNRRLLEAVVSNSCPLIGRTIRAGQFRTVYNAAVIAVARNGTRIRGKVGDIRLLPGDVLLLEARPNFLEQQRNRRDFYLVSEIESASPLARERAPIALLLVAGMIAASGSGLVSIYTASLLAALITVASGCCSASVARRAIDWEVVLVIGGALALGKAMENSGLSSLLGGTIAALVGSSPTATLAALFLASAVLAGVVTAKASVVLMLPVALAIAEQLSLALMPLVVIVMLASATAVATPIGYPTNLMVMGPGGYRFSDYLRLGGPLTLFIGGLGVLLVPLFWPLS